MHIFKEIKLLRAFLNEKKATQQSIGLVPTMGALHQGHLALIQASKAENTLTVCSIYINPAQFNNTADLEKYPRTIPADIALLEGAGCEVLFCPDNQEMYPEASTLTMDFGGVDKILEGKFRPGHFSGVGLVVSKLFNIVAPDRAYFGQKDFQQFSVIEKLVKELQFGLELRRVPTLREGDGLAMSSRNMRLKETDRKKAVVFFNALSWAKEELRNGTPLAEIKEQVKKTCEILPGVRLDYFEVADSENLILLESVNTPGQSVMLIAGFVGEVRLIDNMMVE
jgi:pantoate--beta-alanine ligase